MTLILLSLLSILVLYFFIAFLPIRICAICGAVSLTWLGLLIGLFLGWHSNVLWLGILMGGSIVGLMYKLEKYFQKKQLINFWLIRILVIVLGFLLVYLFLIQEWVQFIVVLVISVVVGPLSLFLVKEDKLKVQDSSTENKTFKQESEKDIKKRLDNLVEKLDKCCE